MAEIGQRLHEPMGAPYNNEFVVFDTETTGLSRTKNNVIQIAALRVKDGVVLDSFNQLCKPDDPIYQNIYELTGISNSMVKDCPSSREVANMFRKWAGENAIFAGHNIRTFDMPFLYKYSDFQNQYIDTLKIAREVLPIALHPDLPNHKLGTLNEYFHLDETVAHRADEDVAMNAGVMYKLFELVKARHSYLGKFMNYPPEPPTQSGFEF